MQILGNAFTKSLASATVLLISGVMTANGQASTDTSWKHEYRAEATKINELVHTKLAVSFDYDKSYMYGKAWITLKPYCFPTDSLTLDAKGMDIKKVAIEKGGRTTPLTFTYDSLLLHIHLDRAYKGGEPYTVYIDYVSRPNELKAKGSAAINDARGLYFINPKGEVKNKPIQIWTQGETESNSAWFPTIDKPNQKSTEEIDMTVPSKYVTLSNGLLVSQKDNGNGTRTDIWKMDLPHAPYLFFMGVGDFSIIKDSYKGKEVAYYVEKPYAGVARRIFGNTPEMIAFYSRILGVDFPWQKYDQMVGRDYVSGAMENTTATLHQESAQQNARELVDGNNWEVDIAHELFHQWFGDLVTCESWSNLTVNESFANFSETIWEEYKFGKDAGDQQNYSDMQGYLQSNSADKHLVRFYYRDKEDMFDAVSYNKGGRILNMLRYYLGDSAFFKALHIYLVTNKFGTGEAHELRLAFEQATGQDMNWYWNQWYFGSGHPKLSISYNYDDAAGKVDVHIQQTQTGNAFILPFAIDVYSGGKKVRHKVWMRSKDETYSFPYTSRPDLVNVDGDKILLCEKKDDKTAANYIFQYTNAGNYVDRKEAIDFAAEHQDDPAIRAFLVKAVNDRFAGLRIDAIDAIKPDNTELVNAALPELVRMASNDKDALVRAKAVEFLAERKDPSYLPLFQKAVHDSSYSVAGEGLNGIFSLDSAKGLAEMQRQRSDAKGKLGNVVSKVLITTGNPEDFTFVQQAYDEMPPSRTKLEITPRFCEYLGKVTDLSQFKQGVDAVIKFRNVIPDTEQYAFIRNMVSNPLKNLGAKKKEAGQQAFSDYIDQVLAK